MALFFLEQAVVKAAFETKQAVVVDRVEVLVVVVY